MKKLIAAAVAAAVIAPMSVMAGGPTLYGKIHTSVDYYDNNGKSSENTEYNEWSLQSNSSRIGVKGSEDLGNGMKIGYLIEWNVDMDGGHDSRNLTTRNRAITLSGDWGTALAGKWDTPFKTVGRKFDMFGDKIGDTRNITELNLRTENTVAYVTPNMNGFSATVAYVFDAGLGDDDGTYDAAYSDDNSDNNAWSFNAIYNNGPILVGVGYILASDDGQKDFTTTTTPAVADLGTGIVTPGTSTTTMADATGTDDQSGWNIGGAYTFGDFKVAAMYYDYDNLGWNKDNDPSVWTLGGSYAMGNNTIKLQYADRDKSGIKVDGSKIKDGGDMWTVGLDHTMSKRTTVYAAYAVMSNDKAAARDAWSGGHGGTAVGVADEDSDAFSVGIIHNF